MPEGTAAHAIGSGVSSALQIRADAGLAAATTLELGGEAEYFLDVRDERELAAGLGWARGRDLPLTVLGGGSNVVIADEGLRGLVVRIGLRGIERTPTDGGEIWRVAAGEPWDAVVAAAAAEGLAGIECLSGIPGLAGAAPVQNIGAYGQEVAETLVCTHVLDRRSGDTHRLAREECGFGYRTSRFKQEPGRWIVTGIELELRSGPPEPPRYAELERALSSDPGQRPTAASVRETVLALRRRKSMVLETGDENRRSAGSFFLNPVLPAEEVSEIERRARAAGVLPAEEELPRFAAAQEHFKVPAAWLIEHAGFARGDRSGAIGISSRHALALVHHGGGTTGELLAYAARIRQAVANRFGVHLVPEPVLLGFAESPLREPTPGAADPATRS